MRKRIAAWLAGLAARRPVLLLAVATVPALLVVTALPGLPVDMSFAGMMDRQDPEVERYFRTLGELEMGGEVLLLLEGPDELLDDAARRVMTAAAANPDVVGTDSGVPAEWLEENAAWLAPRDLFDQWLAWVEGSEDIAEGMKLLARFRELQESTRTEGSRLVTIRLRRHPLEVDFGGSEFLRLEEQILASIDDHRISAGLSGLPAVAAQDQSRTMGSIKRLTPVSLLLALLLFRFLEPRLLGLLAVLAPLALAVVVTLVLTGWILGGITVMETFFGIMVFGLGIDFGIHLLSRLQEEQAAGKPFEVALSNALALSGAGVAAGAVTTGGAFLIVAMAPEPVARHLGFPGGIGLLLCLALTFTVLPALWALLERLPNKVPPRAFSRSDATGSASKRPLGPLERIAAAATERANLTIAMAGVLAVTAMLGTARWEFETDLTKVFNRQVPALAVVERVQELHGLNGAPWFVAVADEAAAAQLVEKFEAHPTFARVMSLSNLLPADVTERQRALAAWSGRAPAGSSPMWSLAAAPLLSAKQNGPPGIEDLPQVLRKRLVAPTGELIVYAWATRSPLSGEEALGQRIAAQSIAPRATSLGVLIENILGAERPWLWRLLTAILAFVALVLWVDFRSLWLSVLALVPVTLGVIGTIGILCWTGTAFNVMTVMVVPLILGLGVDDGIHVVHRLREDGGHDPAAAAAAVGRAITMTTATTCSSFFVLLFADHPGLESMAWVMLIGLPLCLLTSITVLPALARKLGSKVFAPSPEVARESATGNPAVL